jgi:hypothetical protein
VGDLMTTPNHFDAIVVGSGISGGWAAKELTEKGLKTLVLERGRNIRHVIDYPTALKDPWQLPHNNRPTNADRQAQPIQSTLYLYDQSTKHHFVDDLAHPYEQGSRSTGIAATRSEDARSCGRGTCSDTAISTSKPTSAKGSASTGQSVTPISRHGTSTSNASSARAARTRAAAAARANPAATI